jgi:hypothetical protein
VSNWRTIYDHPSNADFKRKRPNPNLIFPGDRIFIPTPGSVALSMSSAVQDPVRAIRQNPDNDQAIFESAIQALEAEVANVGSHLAIDATARQAYVRQIKAMADDLRSQASSGRMTWSQAAAQAQETRNAVMEIIRSRSTSVGRAMAEQLKREGKTLNELVARKASQLYGPNVNFSRLSSTQQNAIYTEIVKSAGRSNPRVTATMRGLSRAGRGLIVLSIAWSTYEVMTADDKAKAAGHELAVTGAGIGGGIAGGALAGLACGPGAPVCVTVGAFIGGALAAFGVDFLW